MSSRLDREQIADRLRALTGVLTSMQHARVAAIGDLVDGQGRFVLRAALEAAEFTGDDTRAQDAFQDFRDKVNARARDAGVDLVLELDKRKVKPDRRHGWFTGDPVGRVLASYTNETSGRTGITRPVLPEVAEIGDSRRLRVYVGFHPTSGNTARRASALIQQLQESLATLAGQVWEVEDSRTVGIGEDTEQARDRLCEQADVRVALISPALLSSGRERQRVTGPGSCPVVPVAFSRLPDGPVNLAPLHSHQIVRRSSPWVELTSTARRAEYVNEVIAAIRTALLPTPRLALATTPAPEDKAPFLAWAESQLRFDIDHLVPSRLAETALTESRLWHGDVSAGPPLQAVERLVEWATDTAPGAARLCALLGDVGMGKTTTAKLFAQRLMQLHNQDPTRPVPILFDLRDLRLSTLPAGAMTLDHILDGMLDARRPSDVPRDRLHAATVRARLDHGDTVIVFDGLDEVLVNLDPRDRSLFTRQLWRALTGPTSTRMLLTCRTQYFRDIRDEAAYFTGLDREGLRGSDYLALLMLPFGHEQIRDYLLGNLDRDPDAVDRFLDTIAAVHDLTDLARRPVTLRMIADMVEFIETAKLEGRALRSVDIYAEVVDRWITRDEGKHTLTPDHKRLLMEEIAAGLWRSRQNSWTPQQVDDWLLDLLDRRPDLTRHYRERLPDLWTADFRTATFLSRDGDTYRFAHRSLFEYFLARHLHRILTDTSAHDRTEHLAEALSMQIPSTETLDFLGQSLAGASAPARKAALDALHRIGRHHHPQASELALAYALHAHQRDYPRQDLTGIDLSGATMPGWRFGSNDHTRLRLTGARLRGANLRNATFHNADLTDADLSDAEATTAEFHHCDLTRTTWTATNAAGTILRHCRIDDLDLTLAHTHRTQLLLCTPTPQPGPELLTAPANSAPSREYTLRHFTVSGQFARCIAWSPDGTRYLTGGGGGARQWDAATGELLHHTTTDTVWSVAWSPDGTRYLTGGDDGARQWDAATGELLHHTTTTFVQTVAWSPDGTRYLTGGDDGARQWDAATGELLHHTTTDTVQAVAWSPDGTRYLTGGDDGARQWDAATGELLHHTTTDTVWSMAWSPDGTRYLTGSSNGCVQVRDVITGSVSGVTIVLCPGGEVVVYDSSANMVVGVTEQGWRWLGWSALQDGYIERLPAETFGELPPLPSS
ncbi:pentapeptide repeat-containing protein [Saccharothrix sp. Mg75]|uniref:NACHT and WD40 repeat domain-containing protein n=1 Tax=Saccharothrix sp. Mg75 TaxID=3445357 RepID=UPI003EEA1EDB